MSEPRLRLGFGLYFWRRGQAEHEQQGQDEEYCAGLVGEAGSKAPIEGSS